MTDEASRGSVPRYDEIAGFYDGVVGDDLRDPVAVALLELLPGLVGLRVLDLACGQGRLSRELARRGASVVGLDLSPALLARARRTKKIHSGSASSRRMRPRPACSTVGASTWSPVTSVSRTSTISTRP